MRKLLLVVAGMLIAGLLALNTWGLSCSVTSVCPHDGQTAMFTGTTKVLARGFKQCLYGEYRHKNHVFWEKCECT